MVNIILQNAALITFAGFISAFLSFTLNKVWEDKNTTKAAFMTLAIAIFSFVLIWFALWIVKDTIFS